jgi:hypothetical protein
MVRESEIKKGDISAIGYKLPFLVSAGGVEFGPIIEGGAFTTLHQVIFFGKA